MSTASLIELLDKHIAMPADDDHQRGWRRACEFIKDKICSGQLSSEIPAVDPQALMNLVVGAISSASIRDPGNRGRMAKEVCDAIRPYLRTTEPVVVSLEKCVTAMQNMIKINNSVGKKMDDFDVVKAVLDAAKVPYV